MLNRKKAVLNYIILRRRVRILFPGKSIRSLFPSFDVATFAFSYNVHAAFGSDIELSASFPSSTRPLAWRDFKRSRSLSARDISRCDLRAAGQIRAQIRIACDGNGR